MPTPTAPLTRITSLPSGDSEPVRNRADDGFRQAMGSARDGDQKPPEKSAGSDSPGHEGQPATPAKDAGSDAVHARGSGDGHDDKPRHRHSEAGPTAIPVLTLIEAARRQVPAATGKALPPGVGAGAAVGAATVGAAPPRASGHPREAAPASLLTTTPTPAAGADATASPGDRLDLPALATGQSGARTTDAPRGEDGLARLIAAGPGALAPQQAPATAAVATPHALSVNVPPQSPQFAPALTQHVAWLAGQEVKDARIQLHPRDLGPINVHVQVHHDRVDVSFAVQHPDTVHALQQTLPQLDSLLARHGLNLGQASVDQQHAGGHPDTTGRDGAAAGDAGAFDGEAPALNPATRAVVGLVDAFA